MTDSLRIVKAKCSLEKTHFGIEFRKNGGAWLAGRTFLLSTHQAVRGFGEGAIDNLQFNAHYAGCPSCKNMAVFKCGTCQALNCQGTATSKEGRVYVTCANCGPVGYLSGVIQDLRSFSDI